MVEPENIFNIVHNNRLITKKFNLFILWLPITLFTTDKYTRPAFLV